jgi:hypothetical protein
MIDSENPEEIISSEWDGRPRRLVAHVCETCEGRFFARRDSGAKSCTRACAAKLRERKFDQICSKCNIVFRTNANKGSRSGLRFCTRKCKDEAQRLEGFPALHPPHYGLGKVHKAQLIRERGHRCEECRLEEWRSKPIALEVHHKDGNPYNDDPENHRLLCPNCHAQTPNYRGKNKGRGRKLGKPKPGDVAQTGEQLVRNQQVASSILAVSTVVMGI